MKILSIILSVILLFGTLNTAFSQTANSIEQCKTVMHEQIVQKKIDGKLRLQKIQVPMKICNATDGALKPKPSSPIKSHTPHKKITDELMSVIFSGKNIIVSIRGNGTIPDFRPTTSTGEYVDSHEIPEPQWKEILEKRKNAVIEKQKDLIKFIEENGGRITYQGSMDNLLYAEIPSILVRELEKRSDVVYIDRGDYKYEITLDGKPKKLNSEESRKKVSDSLQKQIEGAKQERIKVVISMREHIPDFRPTKPSGEYYGMPDLTQEQRDEVMAKRTAYAKQSQKDVVKFIENNGGRITYQDGLLNSFYAEIPSALVKDLEKRNDVSSMDIGDRKFSAPMLRAKNRIN